jgi:hypothetical protein
MNFVSRECIELGRRAGAVVFRGVRVAEADPELRREVAGAVAAARARFADLQAVRATPEVVAFQAALPRVGVDPRRDKPSVEYLKNRSPSGPVPLSTGRPADVPLAVSRALWATGTTTCSWTSSIPMC